MKINKTLQVLYKDRLVGTLALTKDGKAAFEYDEKCQLTLDLEEELKRMGPVFKPEERVHPSNANIKTTNYSMYDDIIIL